MPRNYIIATTPRTGSYLLCEGLNATGVAGYPQEYASPDDITTWKDFYGFSTHIEYFFNFPNLCRTPNKVFGAKLMWLQFIALGCDARHYLHSDRSTPDIIRTLVGPIHIVRLVRRDILRQAISWIRAQTTGIWSQKEDDFAAFENTNCPDYDASVLQVAIEKIHDQNRSWDAALSLFEASILNIAYEDLAMDYQGTVSRVLDFLELPQVNNLPKPLLKKQSDEITEEWVKRASHDLNFG
jgi:trehalose 2-sulfotransferase